MFDIYTFFGISFSMNDHQKMFENIDFEEWKKNFFSTWKKKDKDILWHEFFNEQLSEKYFDFKE